MLAFRECNQSNETEHKEKQATHDHLKCLFPTRKARAGLKELDEDHPAIQQFDGEHEPKVSSGIHPGMYQEHCKLIQKHL